MPNRNKPELLPGKVVLRLIQPGSGAGSVSVLGRSYVASYAGINATLDHSGAGFSEGSYTRMLNAEGEFKVVLPNSTGTDGMLHRLRFLCLTASNYRPADEWIEVYRVSNDGVAGDLLFVGTPTKWVVTETQITLTGYDAFWTLKKMRETNAGWWCNSARDVFEEYTKANITVAAEGFDDVATNFTTQASATAANSADGKWWYYGAKTSPGGNGLRLCGSGAATFGEMRSNSPVAGTVTGDITTRWRWEAGVTLGPGVGGSSVFTFAVLQDNANDFSIQCVPGGTSALYAPSRPTRQFTSPTTGYHTFAIEGRGRWVYYYIDGALIGSHHLPYIALSYTLQPRIFQYNLTGDSTVWADVDYCIFRNTVPYLSRNPSVVGDYRLPGLAVPGGLMQAHWVDVDIKGDSDYPGMTLNPLRAPATQRGLQVKSLSGMDENNGAAPAAWLNTGYGASRFTGSVYLDFDNFDYRFQSLAAARSRVWIGETRFGKQIIDTWTATPGSPYYTVASSAPLRGTGSSKGFFYGQKSGWYPIVVEVMQHNGPPNDNARECLSYMRSDHPNWSTASAAPAYIRGTIPVNTPAYDHAILGEPNLLTYMPLNQANSTSNGVGQMEAVNGTGTSWVILGSGAGSYGTPAITGPVADDPAFGPCNAGYARDGNNVLSPNGLAGVTFEAWIKPASTNTGVNQTIISKPWTSSASVGIYLAVGGANTIYWAVRNAAGTLVVTNTVAFTTINAWTHVAGTYDNATGAWAIYINGVIPAGGSGTATTGACNWTAAFPAQVGSHYNAGTPNTFFGGYISRVAVYGRALPASSILAHFNAASSPMVVSGRTYQSAVPTSPQGIFEQQVRNDSYYEQLRGFFDNFALQATCVPMSLESGEFPGRLVPVVKQGRDTDFIVDHTNCASPTLSGDAEGVADTFVLDAQGIADQAGKAQLFMEGFNFAEVGNHLYPSTEYDSPGDINNLAQMNQRAQSLIALRTNPWTSIDAKPPGQRELVDTLPLTGALAEFAWEPGDGCRVQLPGIGIDDQTARQILQAAWDIYPYGIGAPSIGWRQRPMSFKEALRKIAKDNVEESRNYQGQLTAIKGEGGGYVGTTAGSFGGKDAYSRIVIPLDRTRVIRCELFVYYQATAISQQIEVAGTATGIFVQGAGRYDITRFIGYAGAGGGDPGYLYARLLSATAGTDSAYYIEAQIRI